MKVNLEHLLLLSLLSLILYLVKILTNHLNSKAVSMLRFLCLASRVNIWIFADQMYSRLRTVSEIIFSVLGTLKNFDARKSYCIFLHLLRVCQFPRALEIAQNPDSLQSYFIYSLISQIPEINITNQRNVHRTTETEGESQVYHGSFGTTSLHRQGHPRTHCHPDSLTSQTLYTICSSAQSLTH